MNYIKLVATAYYQLKLKEKCSAYHIHLFNFKIHFHSFSQILTLFEELFIDKCYHFTIQSKHPKIVDGGANIGMSILYFKYLYPNAHITTFEPSPESYHLLEKNILENNLKDITLYPFALSDEDKTITFYQSSDKGKLNSSIEFQEGAYSLEVKAVQLSSYLTEEYDLLKLDIEGAEGDVINELEKNNKLHLFNKMVIECHHNQEKNIIPLLKAEKFSVKRMKSLNQHPIYFFERD